MAGSHTAHSELESHFSSQTRWGFTLSLPEKKEVGFNIQRARLSEQDQWVQMLMQTQDEDAKREGNIDLLGKGCTHVL